MIKINRELLKNRRNLLGYTQKDMADMLGLKRTSYTNLELGIHSPPVNTIIEILKILSLSFEELYNVKIEKSKKIQELEAKKKKIEKLKSQIKQLENEN